MPNCREIDFYRLFNVKTCQGRRACKSRRLAKQHAKKRWCVLLLTLFALFALNACKTTQTAQVTPIIIQDSAFANHKQVNIETPEQIFALDEAASNFVLKMDNTRHKDNQEKVETLVAGIFDRSILAMDYDIDANTTATQTYHQRAANCLSLTIMTYAMVEKMGLEASFQKVHIPEYWTRRDGNTIINGHINLRVKNQKEHAILNRRFDTIVDFQPVLRHQAFPSEELTKNQIVAAFYVNKGAELMMKEHFNDAFAYFNAAINKNAEAVDAWLNLGVLYVKKGLYSDAENVYLHALKISPTYKSANENLAKLYKRIGQHEKASAILRQLNKQREQNPFYQSMRAELAFEEGLYEHAINHYRRAIKLKRSHSDFYFGLARAYWAKGDLKRSKQSLKKAIKHSETQTQSERYLAKQALFNS
jgi:Tfp pilus assembly protein PilF